jgi:hypothetical protein
LKLNTKLACVSSIVMFFLLNAFWRSLTEAGVGRGFKPPPTPSSPGVGTATLAGSLRWCKSVLEILYFYCAFTRYYWTGLYQGESHRRSRPAAACGLRAIKLLRKQQPIAGRSWMGMIHVEIMMNKLRETRSAMETGLHCLVDPVKLNCFVC